MLLEPNFTYITAILTENCVHKSLKHHVALKFQADTSFSCIMSVSSRDVVGVTVV